jgi:SAM-dependent methyltransferase
MSMSQAVRAQLHDHPRLWLAARAARRAAGRPLALAKRATQRREIDRYLATHERRHIVLGAGPHRRDGWLSTDLRPASWATYLDVSRAFPLPDAVVDRYHAEHLIEHIGYHGALRMAQEMRRTLRPGGIARIATPDLGKIAALLQRPSPDGDAYVERANTSWAARPEAQVNGSMPVPYRDRAAFVLNRLFYGFGHQFVFDRTSLGDLLELAGFATLRWYDVGQSEQPELRNIESHGARIGHAKNDYETMVVEAS